MPVPLLSLVIQNSRGIDVLIAHAARHIRTLARRYVGLPVILVAPDGGAAGGDDVYTGNEGEVEEGNNKGVASNEDGTFFLRSSLARIERSRRRGRRASQLASSSPAGVIRQCTIPALEYFFSGFTVLHVDPACVCLDHGRQGLDAETISMRSSAPHRYRNEVRSECDAAGVLVDVARIGSFVTASTASSTTTAALVPTALRRRPPGHGFYRLPQSPGPATSRCPPAHQCPVYDRSLPIHISADDVSLAVGLVEPKVADMGVERGARGGERMGDDDQEHVDEDSGDEEDWEDERRNGERMGDGRMAPGEAEEEFDEKQRRNGERMGGGYAFQIETMGIGWEVALCALLRREGVASFLDDPSVGVPAACEARTKLLAGSLRPRSPPLSPYPSSIRSLGMAHTILLARLAPYRRLDWGDGARWLERKSWKWCESGAEVVHWVRMKRLAFVGALGGGSIWLWGPGRPWRSGEEKVTLIVSRAVDWCLPSSCYEPATYLTVHTPGISFAYRIVLPSVTGPRSPRRRMARDYGLSYSVFVFLSSAAPTCSLDPLPPVLCAAYSAFHSHVAASNGGRSWMFLMKYWGEK
ncbi:hypothetical protein R3P38DRAFT_3502106 [Favolaschia claudopus]|uniref:Uncharacterized protein n=1 Tax=Favolaschia claudopus TaxID=2862362 RepID=A0AAV9Z4M7_9AGAR